MTSFYLKNIFSCITFSQLAEHLTLKGEAVIVIAKISTIKGVNLPINEQDRAEQITHQHSRERYLAGRYLLRGILAKWLEVPPEHLMVALSDSGKPYLVAAGLKLYFSLTHTDDLVALAIADQPIGIDLERERKVEVAALARRFFSHEEAMMLEQSESQRDFFQLWTSREAAIKADGRGMAHLLPLIKAQLPLQNEDSHLTIEGKKWFVSHRMMGDALHAAIAFQEKPSVIHWCEF